MTEPIHCIDPTTPIVLALGQFDGVHRGHQSVFQAAIDSAQACGGSAECLTFSPHVLHLLDPDHAPPLLSTPRQLQRAITACGIHQIHILAFTHEFAAMSPLEFLHLLKARLPTLVEVVVGTNFTFGKNHEGNTDTLLHLAKELHLRATIVPHLDWVGEPISSSRIRAAVQKGDFPLAATLLGRPYALAGTVVHGRGAGRKNGFPTANIRPELPIRPAPGIYAAQLHLKDGAHPGAAFVPDPTDPAQDRYGDVIEIHLPGFSRDIYDQSVEVSFIRRLRGHMPFADADAAAKQIALDTADALQANESLNS